MVDHGAQMLVHRNRSLDLPEFSHRLNELFLMGFVLPFQALNVRLELVLLCFLFKELIVCEEFFTEIRFSCALAQWRVLEQAGRDGMPFQIAMQTNVGLEQFLLVSEFTQLLD